MAESFARQTPGPVQQQAAPGAGPMSASGGQGVQFTPAARVQQQDPTLGALLKMSRGALAPKLQQIEQEQFLQGVQRAQEGETIKEIVDSRPWYSEIFGPSSAVLGAQAYTKQAQIAGWGAQMENDMAKLAEQSPDAMRQHAMSALDSFMTGDKDTDSAIRAAAAEQMAPLFKRHARENYIYNQRKANDAQRSAWEQLGASFNSQMSDPHAPVEDKDAAVGRFLSNLVPFADQTEESFNANVGSFLGAAAAAGNFQVINLFKRQTTDDGATMWSKLPPDVRDRLDAGLPALARKALDKRTGEFATELAFLVNDMTQNPRLVPQRIAEFNRNVAQRTGIYEVDMIPPQNVDGVVGAVLRAQQAQAEQDARAAAANVPDNRPALALAALEHQNGLKIQGSLGVFRESDAEAALTQAWLSNQEPQARAALLNKQSRFSSDVLRASMVDTLTTEEYTPGAGNTAAVFNLLSDAAKGTYFDGETAQLLTRFNSLVAGGNDPVAAWSLAQRVHPVGTRAIPEQEREGVQKAIREYAENANENIFGWNKVSDASLRMIEAVMTQQYTLARSTNTVEASAKQALYRAMRNGLSVVGGHAILAVDKTRATDLFKVVGEGAQATADAFDALMEERAKAQGVSLDNYLVVQQPDTGRLARYQVSATADDGRTVTWSISSDDIKAHVVNAIGKQMKEKPSGTASLTDITGVAP